ncbi:uncharacterized protein LOC128245019 [Mya arenaria]|uniref:uncharacterized protein LOC128245019 n=1 Tax=Mya arenaria TaxID=6604 RepID=UPI0022E88A4B|nr:uncharacterized protein LOC128245019 [Mya arenaria]XP_052819175.1 uncharacterized protein LOC128245019 [Mya arenaria]XP_052819176.1 uncharacterized protein LOC128245019 [Mya arenaria]
MTDEMYHILSSKIDSMNLEMALIRKEQLQTKQELREAKDEIAKLQGLQGLDEPDTTADDLTDAKGNASTSSVINSAQKAFQNEKAQTKQVLDQIKTDIAIIRSDFNTLMATVATLNGTQINLTREIFEVGRDAKNDIKKVNDTLARAESNHTSCTSLSDTQRRTNDTMSLLEKDVQSLKLSVSGINTSLEEKCQSGEFGPRMFNPRPSYPWIMTTHFQPAFSKTPAIVYGLKVLDVSNHANVRVKGEITELTNTYFKFKISEWEDTFLYGTVFSWMACPK